MDSNSDFCTFINVTAKDKNQGSCNLIANMSKRLRGTESADDEAKLALVTFEEQEKEGFEQEIEKLKSQIERLKRQKEESEADIKENERKIAHVTENNTVLQSSLQRLQSQLAESETVRVQLDGVNKELTIQNASLAFANEALNRRVTELTELLASKIAEIEAQKTVHTETISQLQKTLQSREHRQLELQEENNTLKSELEAVQENVIKLSDANTELAESTRLKETSTQQLIENQNRTIENLTAEIIRINEKHGELTASVETSTTAFTTELAKLRTSLESAERDRDENWARVEQQEKVIKKLLSENTRFLESSKAGDIAAQQLQAELEKARQELEVFKAEMTELQDQVNTSETQRAETERELVEKKEQLETLLQDKNVLQERIDSLDGVNETLREAYEEQTEFATTQNKRVQAMQARIDEQNKALETLEQQRELAETYKRQVEEIQAGLQFWKHEYEHVRAEYQSFTQQFQRQKTTPEYATAEEEKKKEPLPTAAEAQPSSQASAFGYDTIDEDATVDNPFVVETPMPEVRTAFKEEKQELERRCWVYMLSKHNLQHYEYLFGTYSHDQRLWTATFLDTSIAQINALYDTLATQLSGIQMPDIVPASSQQSFLRAKTLEWKAVFKQVVDTVHGYLTTLNISVTEGLESPPELFAGMIPERNLPLERLLASVLVLKKLDQESNKKQWREFVMRHFY